MGISLGKLYPYRKPSRNRRGNGQLIITTTLEEKDFDALDSFAKEKDICISAACRVLIEAGLKSMQSTK